jgi:hypothetical protein
MGNRRQEYDSFVHKTKKSPSVTHACKVFAMDAKLRIYYLVLHDSGDARDLDGLRDVHGLTRDHVLIDEGVTILRIMV